MSAHRSFTDFTYTVGESVVSYTITALLVFVAAKKLRLSERAMATNFRDVGGRLALMALLLLSVLFGTSGGPVQALALMGVFTVLAAVGALVAVGVKKVRRRWRAHRHPEPKRQWRVSAPTLPPGLEKMCHVR